MSVKLSDKQRLLVFINVMITGIATSMLATAMTTALPPVTEYFGISTTTGQWMTSGYSLAMGIVMPLTAFLVKKIPTKRLYISGIICFIIGELICIFTPVFSIMMVGRILQAIGNGVLTSMGQVIILSVYPAEKKGTMMGWYGLAATAAPIIAPTIAGVLVMVKLHTLAKTLTLTDLRWLSREINSIVLWNRRIIPKGLFRV